MKIGLQLYLGGDAASPEFLSAAAVAIEERGFHEIWFAEHIALPPKITSRYPYSENGDFPFDSRLIPLEPFTAMTFVAAQTKKVRLAPGVSVLPLRNPVFAAKQSADTDVLSGGRVDYGMGAGWCLEEIAALGTPPQRRGARMDEYIRLIKRLWTEDLVEHHGEFYNLPAVHCAPKPTQRPHPPIFIGGNSKPAMRRTAELGDGWFGAAVNPDAFATHIDELKAACSRAGRNFDDLTIAVGPPNGKADLDMVKRYRDGGADQVTMALSGQNIDRFLSRLDGMAEQVAVPARQL